MCHVHFIRDVLRKVPRKRWKEVSKRLKESLESAEKLQEFIEELEKEWSERAANVCERFIYNLFNYKEFPKSHHRRIRTTNMMERINKEIKRRTKVARAFPNEESLLKLTVMILLDINEE